jgi:hypothetical protein
MVREAGVGHATWSVEGLRYGRKVPAVLGTRGAASAGSEDARRHDPSEQGPEHHPRDEGPMLALHAPSVSGLPVVGERRVVMRPSGEVCSAPTP